MAAGHGVAWFDFARNCESQGRLRYAVYGPEREKVRAVVTRLRRVGLGGSGLCVGGLVRNCNGASAALIYAREYVSVVKVVSVVGDGEGHPGEVWGRGGAPHEQLERAAMRSSASDARGGERKNVRFEVGKEETGKREVVECGGAGGEVLVAHGDMDDTIPVEDAWEVGKSSGRLVVVVKGAGHGFCRDGEERRRGGNWRMRKALVHGKRVKKEALRLIEEEAEEDWTRNRALLDRFIWEIQHKGIDGNLIAMNYGVNEEGDGAYKGESFMKWYGMGDSDRTVKKEKHPVPGGKKEVSKAEAIVTGAPAKTEDTIDDDER